MLTISVHAQTGDGSINISVKDQFGGVVAGAEITITVAGDPARVQKVKTDVRGNAVIRKLSAGEYIVTAAAAGFEAFKTPTVTVKSGELRDLNMILQVAQIESNVEISEEELASSENSGGAIVLTESDISKLPDDQAELERAIKRIGQAATGEDLPISVNGVQGGNLPPKEAIQQIRVNQNVFSAQYDGPFGGGIDIYTRSSVDKFRTYAGFTFADSRFNAADPFIGQRIPYQLRNFSMSLSGPLLSKKANFFIYGNHGNVDSSSVINAIILDDNLRPAEFKAALRSPSQNSSLSLVVNADVTAKHKFYISYYISLASSKNQNMGGFSLPSRANDDRQGSHYFQFSDTFLINPNIVNQTRYFASYSKNESSGGSNDPAVNVLDAFFGGGSQANSKSSTFRFDTSNETSWQMGRYSLGFGVRFRGEKLMQTSLSNFGGTYTFSGRTAPVLDADNQPIVDESGLPIMAQISSLESYRRTLLFQRLGYADQQIRLLGGGANQFTIAGGDPDIRVSQYELGVYLQNSYKISHTLAASFGLRYEDQTNLNSRTNFAPRFGLIWSPKAKEKQNPLTILPRVSIGYGVFYSRFSLNNTVSARQASDPNRLQYLVTETNILDMYPGVPTVEALQQFALPRTQRFINDQLETPFQSLLNITVTKRMPKGFSLNFLLSHGTTFRQSTTRNINAPLAGTFDPLDPSSAVRPFGNVGNMYETSSIAKANATRYSINLSFPQSQKLFANVRYTFWRSSSNVIGSSGSPHDAFDFSQEFAPTGYDGVHGGGGYFYLTLPWGMNLGGDFSVSSGRRFNITTGRDTNGDGAYTERPSFAADPSKPGLIETKYGLLDPNPGPGDLLIPRNLGRGPSSFMLNSSFSKSFGFNGDKAKKVPPKQRLSFSVQVNNILNIINKGTPVGNMASPNFLRSLSGFSDGSVTYINGIQQYNFVGRSMNATVGFSF